LVIGDPKCGKTSLITRWTEKKYVDNLEDKSSSSSVLIQEKSPISLSMQNQKFKVIILDGSEWSKLADLKVESENPFVNVDGIFICYDISSRESFENLDKKWKVFLEKHKAIDQSCIIITACKGDLAHSVDTTLIKMTKAYIDEDVVTSSKTGSEVDEALHVMVSSIMNSTQPQPSPSIPQSPKSSLRGSLRNVGENPHQFKLKFFKSPTWCQFCDLFIWGVTSAQGFECTKCKYASHKKCVKFVPDMCGLNK